MTPSIGRIVIYQRHGSPNGQHKAEPSPAIITKVHDAETGEVDLCIFNPTGLYFDQHTKEYRTDGPPVPGQWSWPPRV
jgi:hypothetical protein